MRLLIVGATGGTGRCLVDQALAAGHTVTAFIRDPARLPVTHPALRVVVGDAMRPEGLGSACVGQEAVCCLLGAKPEGPDAPRAQPGVPVCSVGTRHLVNAMHNCAVQRLVVESSVSVGDSKHHGRFPAPWVLRTVLREVMGDKEVQEAVVRDSGLEWTIIRPAKMTFGPLTGQVDSARDLPWGLTSRVSRADVAAVMLGVLSEPATVGVALTVAQRTGRRRDDRR